MSGLTLFGLLTRRPRRLTDAVGAFEHGDLSRRVPAISRDETDRLGQSFNRMADTISADIERMQLIDTLRRELVANVSLDLRSPLASIRGYLETVPMRVGSPSTEECRNYLDVSLRNTLTLERLVDDLFELSSPETSGYQPSFEQLPVGELIQDVVVTHRPIAERKGVELVADFSPDLHAVRGDIALLGRAISSLLDNSIRYTDPGGRVLVALRESDDDVKLTVPDNGHGIPAEDLPFIFDQFYRGERCRVKRGGGPVPAWG